MTMDEVSVDEYFGKSAIEDNLESSTEDETFRVIVDIAGLSWRPIIEIPAEHVPLFEEWLDLISEALQLEVKPEISSEEIFENFSKASEAYEKCQAVIAQCLIPYGWTEEECWLYDPGPSFEFEKGHPERPYPRNPLPAHDPYALEFSIKLSELTAKSLTDFIKDVPPAWNIQVEASHLVAVPGRPKL